MNKKAIAILGGIFILIVATLGFLIFSRGNSNENQNTNTETPIVEETPVIEEPVVEEPEEPSTAAVRLTDESVVSPILFFQGNGISYFNTIGQLFQTDLQVTNGTALLSNKTELSIALKSNISKILWPLVGRNFIAEFTSGTKKTWSLYDINKASYVEIPDEVYSLDWMPTGDKIMYVWVDSSGKATLKIGNPDTTGYQNLADLYSPDSIISVSPDGKNVLMYSAQTIDTTKNQIKMVTSDGKTFSIVVADGYNTGVRWSPDSRKFLFTRRDNSTQKFGLWVADVATGEVRNLGVTTSETKTAWSKNSQFVFAGVPNSGTVGQGLTQDTFYRIDVTSAQSQQFEPGIAIDAQNLFLSTNEDVLFFKNAQDNALYYIPVQ